MRILALLIGTTLATTPVAAPVLAHGVTPAVQIAKHTAGVTHSVAISNFKFTPPSVTVNVGDTVTWTNMGPSKHTTTSDATTPLWDSGPLDKGKSFSHTFTAAGTFPYHCTIHDFMKGTVTVVAAKKMKM